MSFWRILQYLNSPTGCSSSTLCCNPGSTCNINSAYLQCAPLQKPQMLHADRLQLGSSANSITPNPTTAPTNIPTSPTATSLVLPSSPTIQTTSFPSSSPPVFVSSAPTPLGAPNIMATNVLSTSGNQIVDSNGKSVRLIGINWFGFETSNAIVHGLCTRNYNSMLGLNNLIAGTAVNSPDYAINSDLAGLTSLQALNRIVAYSGSIGLRIWHSANADNFLNEPPYRDSVVIGADLWNEPKNVGNAAATWGTGDISTDRTESRERHSRFESSLVNYRRRHFTTYLVGRQCDGYCQDVYNQPWLSSPLFPTNLRPRWNSFWGLFRTQTAPLLIELIVRRAAGNELDLLVIQTAVTLVGHPPGRLGNDIFA
eukprot:gene32823-42495_t